MLSCLESYNKEQYNIEVLLAIVMIERLFNPNLFSPSQMNSHKSGTNITSVKISKVPEDSGDCTCCSFSSKETFDKCVCGVLFFFRFKTNSSR